MRKFGTDAPEFFVFEYEGKEYKLPLLGSLSVKKLEGLDAANQKGAGQKWQLDFLREHMGAKVVDNMPASIAGEILRAWSTETRASGASEGES